MKRLDISIAKLRLEEHARIKKLKTEPVNRSNQLYLWYHQGILNALNYIRQEIEEIRNDRTTPQT